MAYFFQITNDWNQALISMIGNLIQGSWRPNKVVQLARCSLNVFACVFVFVFLSLSSNDTVNADIYNAATMMAVVIDFPATLETCDMLPLPYIWQRSQLWKLYLLMLFFIVNHIETEKRDHLYSRSHIGCYGQLMRMSCLSHNGCNILHGEIHKIVLCLKPLYSFLHQQYLKWNKRFSFLCIFFIKSWINHEEEEICTKPILDICTLVQNLKGWVWYMYEEQGSPMKVLSSPS